MDKQRDKPWVTPAPTLAVSMAIKAIAAGTANDEQQKRAMSWIINTLCGTYDLSYRPNSERDTCLAEGKRLVGLALVKEINMPVELLRRNDK